MTTTTCSRCDLTVPLRDDGTLARHGNVTTGECLPSGYGD